MMNKEVEEMLNRSPNPLPWTIVIFLFAIGAIVLQSANLAAIWGIVVGAYFGNYRGRFVVMEAWRKQMNCDHENRVAELEAEYEATRSELTPCKD